MAEIKITRDNFQREVLQAEVPVLVDFWAAWCGPCRMLSPVISEIAAQAEGKYKVGKVNVDEEPELASAYRVSSIPTLLVFRDGKAAASSVGVQSRDDIEDMGLVDREEWTPDGSWIGMLEIPAGLITDLTNNLKNRTHGKAQIKLVSS